MVYDDVQGQQNHIFTGNQSEYITVFKPGKCNVVVYRSRFWRGSPENALITVTKEVQDACKAGILKASDYTETVEKLYGSFKDIQFLGLIAKENDVSIRSANSFGRIWGPGYWDTVKVLNLDTKEDTGKEFLLIAGYK
uniref:Lipoprotein n=1 Tax=Caenorhabditis tropicalis TaxID=1561998 RepID=A0A1I7TCA1_9PELO